MEFSFQKFNFCVKKTISKEKGDASCPPKFPKSLQQQYDNPTIDQGNFFPGVLTRWLGVLTFELPNSEGPWKISLGSTVDLNL